MTLVCWFHIETYIYIFINIYFILFKLNLKYNFVKLIFLHNNSITIHREFLFLNQNIFIEDISRCLQLLNIII